MSEYFTCKWAAEVEYEQMGKSMNFYVLQGKAWIYRKQIHLPDRQSDAEVLMSICENEDDGDEDQPEEEPKDEDEPEEEPALKRRRTSLLPDWGP